MRVRPQGPDKSEVTISCDLGTEPDLRNRKVRGEISKEKSPLRFCAIRDRTLPSFCYDGKALVNS